jgi:hypothetical protein
MNFIIFRKKINGYVAMHPHTFTSLANAQDEARSLNKAEPRMVVYSWRVAEVDLASNEVVEIDSPPFNTKAKRDNATCAGETGPSAKRRATQMRKPPFK